MIRPTIGVTSPQRSGEGPASPEVLKHATLLKALGADVVVLTRGQPTAHALEQHALHGVLFSGGGDVSASLYGGRTELSWDRIDAERDQGELTLLRNTFAQRVPALCVCRGMQLANIAFGGTLIEDIKKELGDQYRVAHHQLRELNISPEYKTHEVRMDTRSALVRVLRADSLHTNSMHHQAIRNLAAPFRAVGYANDGVIEAIEFASPEFFFFGVQWHPESLADDDASIRLYSAFLAATRVTQIADSGMYEQ